MTEKYPNTDLHLDPNKFPKRIDLELSIDTEAILSKKAAKAGISVGEYASMVISNSLGEQA